MKSGPRKAPILKGIGVAVILTATFLFVWRYYGTRLSTPAQEHPLVTLDKLENGIPLFTLIDLSGAPYSIEEARGKIVVLNFWATWCAPCVEEFPSMIRLVEHFKGELLLVTIAADERKEDVLRFIEALRLESKYSRNLWDPERKIADQFGTKRLPETYILSRDLKLIRKVVNSQDWSDPRAIQFFETLLPVR